MDWFIGVLKNKYADFSGRARRKEYWMFFLFYFILAALAAVLDAVLGAGFIGVILALALLLPSIAVTARRLHDTGRSAWWILIGFVPIIGALILLVFMVLDSEPTANDYGPNPKAEAA